MTVNNTIVYLKEKGMWSEANERRQAYNVKLMNLYMEGFNKCVAEAQSKKMKIDPSNKEWVTLWDNYKKEMNLPRVTVLTDAEIEEGLKKLK